MNETCVCPVFMVPLMLTVRLRSVGVGDEDAIVDRHGSRPRRLH
jgi:hypothetical protein